MMLLSFCWKNNVMADPERQKDEGFVLGSMIGTLSIMRRASSSSGFLFSSSIV